MTNRQRREYSALYQARVKIFERKYKRIFKKILSQQVNKAISDVNSGGIHHAQIQVRKEVILPHLVMTLHNLYKEVGVYFAKRTNQEIRLALNQKTGTLGTNPQWVQDILDYFNTSLLNQVAIEIQDTTRNIIENILSEAVREGWGSEQTAREMTQQLPDMTRWRAELIARTESAKAAFVGRQVAASAAKYKMNKEWITAEDSRVRASHRPLDGVIIEEDEDFDVDGEQAAGPGDPRLSAGEVCNCRCVVAYIPQRSTSGRLIPKE